MELLGLELAGFRRFETASINLLDHLVAVVGPNEAGKTSLLEALTRLITGQRRNRIFRYGPYLALFQDTESPKAAAEPPFSWR